MLKKILPLFILLSFLLSKSYSQDFLGLSTGNFSGISGVMLQPASIVDSRFKFDINLFSTSVNYSNNYFLLDKDAILKFNKNKFDSYASFKDRYLSEASLGTGEKVFFNINNRTQLPLSFMVTTGKKSAIALNMQFRTMIQGRGISQDFANLAYNDFHPPLNNTSVDVSGISLNSLSWAEVGFTYGKVLFSSGKHFLKGAITGKYLAGLSSLNLASGDLQMQVNSDSTFNFNTTDVSYNHNKNADFDKLFNKNFRPNANAFGLDAGLVYEYRGNIAKFKYLKIDDEVSYDALRRDVNKYIFKLGVSLLDVGVFNFEKPADVNSFSANINNWDLRNAHYNSIKDFDTALAKRVIANPNDPRNYKVYLPTALSAQLDIKFVKGLFLNVMSYWPVSMGDKPGKRFDKFGYYTITPRYETRHFGIYIPYTITQRNDFTDYKEHLLGATVRIGPLFIGSSNLGGMLFNNTLKSADVHVGLKVGFTYGKPNISNRILGAVLNESPVSDTSSFHETKDEKIRTAEKTGKDQNENSVILDYKAGKVYDNPGVKQNITIINNYYYGINPAVRMIDTISLQNNYPGYYTDSLQAEALKIAGQRNKAIADSLSKVTTDSLKIKRKQLDSLVRSMQQLQKQMDSTTREERNIEGDSSLSYNIKMDRLQSGIDSLSSQQDSLQRRRGEALMTRETTLRLDTARADLSRQKEQFPADKKKDKPATDSGLIKSNSEARVAVTEDLKADTADMQIKKEADFTRQLQQMQDSVDRISKRNSEMTDSLTQAKSSIEEVSKNKELVPEKATVPSLGQENRNTPGTKESERLQKKQNELLSQYARQADMLSKDIDRLNSKMNEDRRIDRRDDRRNNNYIPVPIPVNNSRNNQREAPIAKAVPPARDTVYIRDTVMLKDSIRKIDSLNNMPSDSFVPRPAPGVTKIDTVMIKEVVKEPGFNYASLPEENVLFALGKKSLQPIYESRLDFIAGILKNNPDLHVTITGHTDSSGSRTVNERLSIQRAGTVADYLMRKGVAKKQIIVVSQSFENPAVSGNSATARSQNRRVALKLEKGVK